MRLTVLATVSAFAVGLLAAGAACAAVSIPGAQITIADLSGSLRVSGTTDASGVQMSRNLPPGAYKMTVVLDAKDPAVRALAADVYVEVNVGGREVSCTRANLSTGAPYSAALLVEGAADLPVTIHLAPRPPQPEAAAQAVAAVPARRGVTD